MVIFVILLSIAISYIFYRKTKPELDTKRRILLMILRAIAISFVFILLFNPVLTLENTSTSGSKVIVLKDVSASMNENIADGMKSDSFLDYTSLLEKKFSSQIKVYDFAENLKSGNDTISVFDSRLIPSIRKLLKVFNHELIQEIVLVSDGWLHDNDLSSVAKLNIPISVCVPEIITDQNDLSIKSIVSNKNGFENEEQVISVSGSLNKYEGPYNINIAIDGNPKVIRKYKYSGTEFTHEISIGSLKKGKHKISGSITFGENTADSLKDINPQNNKKFTSINIMDSKKTVLCISDFPDNDLRYIKNAVLTDEHLDFRFLLYKQDKLYHGRNEVKMSDELNEKAGVLIISNHGKIRFNTSQTDNIKSFMKRKKGLVFLGDPECGLEDILNSEYEGFPENMTDQIKVSRSGKKIRIFESLENIQNQLPPLGKIHLKPDPAKKILAVFDDGDNSPAIVTGSVSGSRIVQFAVRDFWKWSMHSDDPDGYNSFILGCIKWTGLSESDLINIELDKDIYFKGDNARILLNVYNEGMERMNDVSAEIFITRENQLVARDFFKTSTSGEFEYIADLDLDGEYDYRVVDRKSGIEKTGKIIVADTSSEAMDSGMNTNLLKYIADVTDGKVFSKSEDIELSESYSISNKKINEISLYNNIYFLMTFLAAFCLELYLRKRWGLI